METWQDRKRWSDNFLIQIKRILGEHFIGAAPVEEDRKRNTDLIVLKLDPLRFACRVRKAHFMKEYSGEFTIREKTPTGNKTEFTKIMEGWGDYLFYGFADDEGLVCWRIGDLKVFRIAILRHLSAKKAMLGVQHTVPADSNVFRAFKWSEFPADFVVASNLLKGGHDATSPQLNYD